MKKYLLIICIFVSIGIFLAACSKNPAGPSMSSMSISLASTSTSTTGTTTCSTTSNGSGATSVSTSQPGTVSTQIGNNGVTSSLGSSGVSSGSSGGSSTGGGTLNPARNLTGTWKSALPCTWYENRGEIRNVKFVGNLEMVLEQTGNIVKGTLYLRPTSITSLIDGHSRTMPEACLISGTVSSVNFSFTDYWSNWSFSFTTDLMQGTVTSNGLEHGYDSDTNALKLIRQ